MFDLATAPFIFNFFAEAFYWLIALFLHRMLCHHPDNFVAIFKAKNLIPEKIKAKRKADMWLTNLLEIL